MKVIYIVGKYTDINNIERNRNINKANLASLKLCEEGHTVICPHTNFKFHENLIGYEGVMKECFELIRRSDTIYVLENWKKSKGSKREIKYAKKIRKEIIYE